MEVQLLWIRPKGLLQDARVVTLLEHVEVNSLLISELDPFSIGVCIKGIHEDQRNIAVILAVDVLNKRINQKSEGPSGQIMLFVLKAWASGQNIVGFVSCFFFFSERLVSSNNAIFATCKVPGDLLQLFKKFKDRALLVRHTSFLFSVVVVFFFFMN